MRASGVGATKSKCGRGNWERAIATATCAAIENRNRIEIEGGGPNTLAVSQ